MGRKQFSTRRPVFFHLAIGLSLLIIFSGCQQIAIKGQRPEPQSIITDIKQPVYETEHAQLEKIYNLMKEGKFGAALAENQTLESHLDYAQSRGSDYDRVIRLSTRINTILLKRIIQDDEKIVSFTEEHKKQGDRIRQQDEMLKKMRTMLNDINSQQIQLEQAFEDIERLETENKTLLQQIETFKKIDLEETQINRTE